MQKIPPKSNLRATLTGFHPPRDFRLGQTVAIIDDRCAAPKGSTGVIIALDFHNNEAWLIMHEFNEGMLFGNTLTTYRGIIVGFRHLIIF